LETPECKGRDLYGELRGNPRSFIGVFGVKPEIFDTWFNYLEPVISPFRSRTDFPTRIVTTVKRKLNPINLFALYLYALKTGETYVNIGTMFRVCSTTVNEIVEHIADLFSRLVPERKLPSAEDVKRLRDTTFSAYPTVFGVIDITEYLEPVFFVKNEYGTQGNKKLLQ
jgi:hypothetical protein